MLTYESLRQAYLVHRRRQGGRKSEALLDTFGASNLEEVAEKDWPALLAAFSGKRSLKDQLATVGQKAFAARRRAKSPSANRGA